MTLRAFLGMYDLPAQHAANDRIWAAMAKLLTDAGVAGVPATLERDRSPARLWRDDRLLFGQACGYPLVSQSLPLRVLALPVHDTGHGPEARHRSLIVARVGDPAATLADLRGRRAAINDRASNSGMNLFRLAIAAIAGGAPYFSQVVVTGAHQDSIRAVLRDEADVAAIDSVTFAGLSRFEPDLVAPLKILAETRDSPTLPFVTARDTPPATRAALRDALTRVAIDPALADARRTLFLTGFAAAPADGFRELTDIADRAAALGYPVIA